MYEYVYRALFQCICKLDDGRGGSGGGGSSSGGWTTTTTTTLLLLPPPPTPSTPPTPPPTLLLLLFNWPFSGILWVRQDPKRRTFESCGAVVFFYKPGLVPFLSPN